MDWDASSSTSSSTAERRRSTPRPVTRTRSPTTTRASSRYPSTSPNPTLSPTRPTPDVDILINNAGISAPTPVLSKDTGNLRRELEVNLFGPLAVTSAFADTLAERCGAVVNVASVLSWLGIGGSYSVSKAALWSATDAMRLDLAPRGVHVLGLYLGYVDTDMTAGVDAPKATPADIVGQVLDGLETGASEVLADDTARQVRASLHRPVDERYAPFAAA